jgi:Tol biopolymer transport system component
MKDPDDRWQSARDVMHELQWISAAGSQAGAPATAPARHRRGVVKWLAIGLLGIAVGAVGTVATMTRQMGSRVVTFTPKTFQPYPIFNARFAPDGESIVFSAAPEGNTPELFSVRPEYIAPRPLGLHAVHLLAVSSSGELAVLTGARHIAHCVFTGTLARLPLGAEAPRELLENVRDADWNPDGSGLAIIREVGGRDRLEYPIGKVLCESGGYLSDVRFSPRGDRIAFFDHPYKWDDRGSMKVTDLSGRVTELSIGYAAEEGIAWSPDGEQIFFSGADSSITSSFGGWVFAVTLSGKRRVAQQGSGALVIHDISRRGHWLVTRDDLRLQIAARPPRASDERDLSWLERSGEPSLSADGRTMLFTENGGQHNVNYQVCLRGTDRSPVVRLGEGSAQQVSPDGRWALAFVPTSPACPMLYPTGAGEPVRLERGNIEAYQQGAMWFPDGRRVVLCGIEPGKSSRVYVQEVPSGKPRAITPEGTLFGTLSPDGRLVLASGSDGSWAIYPVEGGTPRPVPGITAREEIARWSKDGLSVYVFDPRQIPCRVDRLSLATGRRDSVMLLGTGNRTGLVRVIKVSMADDPHIYAYSHYHMLSTLFVVDGAR